MQLKGNIFNIQHFTIHDGPGIRTELFLKGCPLSCKWCGNPESQNPMIQPGVFPVKCISVEKCGMCVDICPRDAIRFETGIVPEDQGHKILSIDRSRCGGCLACVEACPADAIKQWGRYYTVDDCMEEIMKDKGFYDQTGGGVTLSGGEPLLQPEFSAEILRRCQAAGIHTCLESSLFVEWETARQVLPYADLVITDLKMMDSKEHAFYIGAGNELVLENIKKTAATGCELVIRIPVIPDVNDDLANAEKTVDFIVSELDGRVRTVQLLSYMRLGEEKYRSIDMPYHMAGIEVDREAFQKKVEGIAEYMNGRGIHCVVGTREGFRGKPVRR